MDSHIKYLFFDLDHTLWDFETNSNETLQELFEEFQLHQYELFDFPQFMAVYTRVNHGLWDEYNRGMVSKDSLRERRFKETFEKLGLEILHHPAAFSDQYIERCTLKPGVFPKAHETLQELKKHFPMLIITNGFPESQAKKLKASGLSKYFDTLIISEEVGYAKPHPGIFNVALEKAGVDANQVLMIGDNLHADIKGAKDSGITPVWFNPNKQNHFDPDLMQINHLEELLALPSLLPSNSQL